MKFSHSNFAVKFYHSKWSARYPSHCLNNRPKVHYLNGHTNHLIIHPFKVRTSKILLFQWFCYLKGHFQILTLLKKQFQVTAAIRPNTKMVWIETPTNPTLKLVDIQAVSDIAHKARSDIIVVVDNTFESAYFQVKFKIYSVFEA